MTDLPTVDPALDALFAGVACGATLAAVRLRPGPHLRVPGPVRDERRTAHFSWRRSAARRAGAVELASWCDGLARELRSGATLGAALRCLAPPPATLLGQIGRRLQQGRSLTEAVALAPTSADEQLVLTVLAACAQHGGPAAQPLDRAAATLRRRAADAAERDTQSAQARLSAQVMTILPVAVLGLLVVTSGPVRQTLATPVGLVVVALGGGLNVAGWLWMRRLVRGRAR